MFKNEADIPRSLWPYAVRHAQYLRNRSFQRRTDATAYELFTGRKPDMRSLHPFGARYVSYAEGRKQKFAIRGKEGIYLGINPMNKGYYVLNPLTGKVITSRNVHVEQEIFGEDYEPEVTSKRKHEILDSKDESKQLITDTITEQKRSENDQQEEQLVKESRPYRSIRPPKYLADYYLNTSVEYAYSLMFSIPNTYEEAIKSKDAEKWRAAMDVEIKSLMDNHTWDLTPLPESRKETIGTLGL